MWYYTLFSHITTNGLKQLRHVETHLSTMSYINSSAPSSKWQKKSFIAADPPELPAGDRRWQENESSDSMSALICCVVVHLLMKKPWKGPKLKKSNSFCFSSWWSIILHQGHPLHGWWNWSEGNNILVSDTKASHSKWSSYSMQMVESS